MTFVLPECPTLLIRWTGLVPGDPSELALRVTLWPRRVILSARRSREVGTANAEAASIHCTNNCLSSIVLSEAYVQQHRDTVVV